MDIPPELCLELLIAADYLDGMLLVPERRFSRFAKFGNSMNDASCAPLHQVHISTYDPSRAKSYRDDRRSDAYVVPMAPVRRRGLSTSQEIACATICVQRQQGSYHEEGNCGRETKVPNLNSTDALSGLSIIIGRSRRRIASNVEMQCRSDFRCTASHRLDTPILCSVSS